MADYLAFLFQSGRSASTMCSHASAVSYGHKVRGLADPSVDFRIKQILAGAKKARPSTDSRRALSLEGEAVVCGTTFSGSG